MVSFLAFATTLMQAVRALQLYGPGHPRTLQSLQLLADTFEHHLAGRPYIQVAARHGRLFVDKVMEEGLNLQLKALIRELEDRDIHAFVAHKGATEAEWRVLLELLVLKPPQLREKGGGRAYLERHDVTHIRILASRLEDVSESGEVASALLGALTLGDATAWTATGLSQAVLPLLAGAVGIGGSGGGAGAGAGGAAGGSGTGTGLPGIPGRSSETGSGGTAVVDALRAHLVGLLQGPSMPNLGGLGDLLEAQGLDRQGASPGTQGALVQAVAGLPAEGRLGLLLGAAQLRSGPLRNVFHRMAGQHALGSIAEAFGHGTLSATAIPEVLEELTPLLPAAEQWGAKLMEALQGSGMPPAQLKELMDVLTWGNLPREERLRQLLEEGKLAEVPLAKVITLLRELLESGDIVGFIRLLQRLGEDFGLPIVERRLAIAEGFEQIARWAQAPGMPEGALDRLQGLLSHAWMGERDPDVHGRIAQAVETLVWFEASRGQAPRAASLVVSLGVAAPDAPWKATALQELIHRLAVPARMTHILMLLHGMDKAQAAERIHPLLKLLGAPAADFLVERLSEEGDRIRRARLLEALRSCGQTAEGPLLEALHAPEWFVVRNALIVLGEVAGPSRLADVQPFLQHKDSRVVRAAIRAVGHLGGAHAEAAILRLLDHRDLEIQLEVLFTVQESGSRNAIPALLDFLKHSSGKRADVARVREKILEVLGRLGSPSVIPTLLDVLARKRGLFGEKKEPLGIRLGALQALLTLDTAEAQTAAARVLEKEPPGPDREAFEALMLSRLG